MRSKRFLVSLCFLIAVWVLFLFGRFFLIEKPIENLRHIPDNSIFAMRLDGSSVLKSTLFSILLEANDPEVIEVINTQINKKWKRKGVNKNLGIDFLSDIVVYVFPFGEGQMLGYTYNLDEPERMRKNAQAAFDDNQFYAINENIGVVLTYLGKKALTVKERTKAIEKAKNIAFHPMNSVLAKKIAEKQTNKFVELTSQGLLYGNSTLFTRTDMDLSLEEHSLVLNGQLIKNKSVKDIFDNKNFTLFPSGMHFYTSLIPEGIQDSLRKFIGQVNFLTPELQAIALNFRGIKINNPDGVLIQSPDMDLVLNFKDPVDLVAAIKRSTFFEVLKWKFLDDQTISNGVDTYYLRKVDNKTYTFSSKKELKILQNEASTLLCVKGRLTHFTNVSGDKWVMLFLNNFPFYANSKSFFSKTKGIQLKVTNTNSNNAVVKGRIDFKDQYSPMNEFFKYAVQNNFIRLK